MAVSFAVTVSFMIALRPLAARNGFVDRPGGRKRHGAEVPVIGGIAMFAGLFAGLLLADVSAESFLSLLAASTLLVVIGLIDDRYELPVLARLASQFAATLIMVYGAGLALQDIGDPFGTGTVGMGSFTLIFTLLVTITMVNAFNFVDGADGLAGTLAFIAMGAVAIVAGPDHPATAPALIVAAATVGYLVFNLPIYINRKLRSFMGDAGSTLLGFSIVWVTLGVSQGDAQVISPVHCLWFAAIPIFDFMTCFVRRIMNRRSPFHAGRDHFHHVLMRGGFTARQALALLSGFQFAYAVAGIAGHFTGVADQWMFIAWAVIGVTQRNVLTRISTIRRGARIRERARARVLAKA
ncbi:MAG TPA: MraY family glycosyltransferase [Woeseiaceae bacterium]|nr:MraY family glycosyltransferase [Woeseiaceae bacterium]